jgi:hypothetical protein
VSPLADGEWIVLDQSERGALLQQNHTREPGIRMLTDQLSAVVTDTFSLHAGNAILRLVRVGGGAFYTASPGGPQLLPSPADPQVYAFEHEDAIWLFRAPDRVQKLTQDGDLVSLRTRQREGEVILYWSVNPVWSGDGRFIAFLSNREAVRGGSSGQSIWVIDAGTGSQRALYHRPRESAHVDAVLGEEFVFTSSTAPGVFSVHPRTGKVTRLGDGYVMGGQPRGGALLLNNDGQLVLLNGSTADTLPDPPAGHVWSTRAAFSPTAERIALFSTDQAGSYTLHVFAADGSAIAPYPLPAPPSYGPAWTTESSLIFTVSTRGSLQTFRAELR